MTKSTTDIISILFLITICVLIFIFGPLAILWALNSLFPVLAIPYNFWNWLAVIVLNATWLSKSVINKKD
jgi:hypothetical protein